MRVPVSWLGEWVDIAGRSVDELDTALVRQGLEVEAIHHPTVKGPLVVGQVESIVELTEFKKPIRHCMVDTGDAEPRSIVCGARNFREGDFVVVALPGSVLEGGFVISSRTTYGHVSDGMICSAAELGLGDDHSGIVVLSSADMAQELSPGVDAIPVLGLDETVFELAITPDMSHCLSLRGVGRELSHALGASFHDSAIVDVPVATAEPPYVVRIEDAGCDRFAGRAVRGIDPVAPTPWWMKARLIHAGMRPLFLAVDVTNYLMLSFGQPMHAFDLKKLQGDLVVRRAIVGEAIRTLDGIERTLHREDLVIADNSGPVSIAAVMGGEAVEISPETTDVLIECAHWDPVTVARTARRHKLPSEAAKRFERGVDPALPPVAAQYAADLLTRLAGGKIDDRVLDIDQRRQRPTINMAASLPSRIAGVQYDTSVASARLADVGCDVKSAPETLLVSPPSWRPDLRDPIDLAEEVIRLEGYDEIPSIVPETPPSSGLPEHARKIREISRSLAESGLTEVLCYPFVAPEIHDKLGLDGDDERRRACVLANPLSSDENELRTYLLPGLLAAARHNTGRGARDVALFEIGKVYEPRAKAQAAPRLSVEKRPSPDEFAAIEAAVPQQPRHLAAVWVGKSEPSGWWGSGRQADWSDAVQAARLVGDAAGVGLRVERGECAPWHPGRCARILTTTGAVVGHAGELHPKACAGMELPPRSCALEIDIDALGYHVVSTAPTISPFPPVLLDVALVVDDGVPADAVKAAIQTGALYSEGGEYLENVELFDVFVGSQLGSGRKSLAFSLTFRAPNRTLTVAEATIVRDAAVAEAARQWRAELRT